MEFRKVFDRIPEQFDQWRPKYCKEAFDHIIAYTGLDSRKSVLEIGPGTGQATEPILATGCDYLAVELGEHLCEYTKNKFAVYGNFHIVNGDFGAYDFGSARFDVIYSAATIQWIPEQIAFSESYALLKKGGYLVMMFLSGDYKTPNEALFADMQDVYAAYFHPETRYAQKLIYANAVHYGFTDFRAFKFYSKREFDTEGYLAYIGTHCDHIVLQEPYRSRFFDGAREAVMRHGGKVEFHDTITVYITQKA